MTDLPYIVVAPSYSPDSGGGIFQHQLVHQINTMGKCAYLWPQPPIARSLRNRLSDRWHDPLGAFRKPHPYAVNPELNTPVARKADLHPDSIVVYPEIVIGNPLKARNVVRWLLYKPGLLHPYKFGPDEMFFRVGELSDLPEITGGAPDLMMWTINPTYRNENRPDRKGACFIVRKGWKKPRIPETEGAIQVDNLSHAEMADVFNRCETFYSYDEATFYSQYAALCGCLSIIIPGLYGSRQEWAAQHDLGRYGVAYGLDDTAHALATRDKLHEMMLQKEAEGLASVTNFITLTQARFGTG